MIRRPVQVANIDLLSSAIFGWLTANNVAHVIMFMGTLNQFATVALWLSGISCVIKKGDRVEAYLLKHFVFHVKMWCIPGL